MVRPLKRPGTLSISASTPRLALTRRKLPFDRLKLAKGASARLATLAGPADSPPPRRREAGRCRW